MRRAVMHGGMQMGRFMYQGDQKGIGIEIAVNGYPGGVAMGRGTEIACLGMTVTDNPEMNRVNGKNGKQEVNGRDWNKSRYYFFYDRKRSCTESFCLSGMKLKEGQLQCFFRLGREGYVGEAQELARMVSRTKRGIKIRNGQRKIRIVCLNRIKAD